MAKVNLTLPNLDLDNLSDSQVIRKIASYLYIQNEQLRYELTHIDEDNMSSENTNTIQGMTQAQVQKAIEEAAKKTQDIDLSSNTIIVNLQRRLDNLGKLQAQDASNITRITQELGNKVSTTVYNAGLSGLRALINGNTALIGGLNTNLGQLATNLGNLSSSYNGHKHQMSIDANGVISMGGPTANPTNPNISATAYFIQRLADARPHSIQQITMNGATYSGNATVFCKDDEEFDVPIVIDATSYVNGRVANARPQSIERVNMSSSYFNGKVTVFCKDDEEFDVKIIIDASAAVSGEYNAGWNDCIDAASGGYYLSGWSDYGNAALYDSGGAPVGNHYWRYGGSRVYRYTLPSKR